MKAVIRKMGNSQGVLIPKPVLAQVGLVDEADMVIENGSIILRKPRSKAREGWAEASQALAAMGDDSLTWPEFGNEADRDMEW